MPDFGMPPVSAGFDARAGWLVNKLLADFASEGMKNFQAAGLVGVLGGESGLKAVQEGAPISGRGGFGWEQATGSRRTEFESWAPAHGLSVFDDEANYGFMVSELRSTESAALQNLLATTSLESAVDSFCRRFERPADPEGEIRRSIPLAQRALAASQGLPHPQAGTNPDESAEELNRQELARIQQGQYQAPALADSAPAPGASPRMAPGVSGMVAGGITGALAVAIPFLWPLLHGHIPDPPDEKQATALASLFVAAGGGAFHLWYSLQWRKGNR